MADEVASKRKSGWHRLLHPKFAVPIVLLLILIATPFLYRSYRLSLISDPGEPFDVEAFIAEHIVTEADNAFVPFHNAHALLTTPAGDLDITIGKDLWDGYAINEKEQFALDYVNDNEEALIAWEKASRMPNFSEVQPATIDFTSVLGTTKNTREFIRMGIIRAWIAYKKGDDLKTSKWLLCNLRTSRMIELNGFILNRIVGYTLHNMTSEIIVKWLAQQQLSLPELEQVLNEIQSIHEMTPPISDHIKMDYAMMFHPEGAIQNELFPIAESGAALSVLPWGFYFQGEPELMYRVSKHCFSNNLKYVDLPNYKRPKVSLNGNNRCYLYEIASEESISPSQHTPEQIEYAAESSVLFRVSYYQVGRLMEIVDIEIIQQRLLEVAVQLEIFRKASDEYPEGLYQVYESTKDLPIDDLEPSGAVLKYAKDGPLHYRLWSVGFDGIDSGGVNLTLDKDAADLGIEMIRKP